MEHLTWQRLSIIAVVTGILAWLVCRLAVGNGYTPTPVPWTMPIVCLIGGVLALVIAWPVRQYQRGKHPGLDGLRAARAAVFAQACAYAGVLLGAGFLGYALALADMWNHGPRRDVAISALIAALGAVLLLIGGLIAEHWCRTKPPEDATPTAASAP